ncbi:MAG: LptF/LptG family permease [Rhodospirillaceae bacterium]|jgi:lipopolysaccharide export system permease protein|nr:LptF/LptG family permease [Rhodospirillaceae bacterium]MBT5567158.1 LptF/LptG family permease [Rhodospirillaceae bacterium]MBT6089371.1 LptF/LptG family permease [Rhodospirillaceae bacterium]MBT7451580.1 LptF/LptG family permease [Rhodospirillaceae bacterium]
MGRIDVYILRQIIPIMLVTLFISVVVLLLEKMLQLLNLTVGSGVSSFVVLQMIASLFPNYIRLVLPLGLFLGIFITFRRLSTQSELHALHAGGVGLGRLSTPVKSLAVVVTFLGLGLTGYIEPLGRFVYHSLHHQVTNGIIEAGIGEGIFIDTPDGYTVRVERSLNAGKEFYGFFGYRENGTGSVETVTARRGEIFTSGDEGSRSMRLFDGEQVSWTGDGTDRTRMNFSVLEVPMDLQGTNPYPARGSDELELTLHELIIAYSRGVLRRFGVELDTPDSLVLTLADSIPQPSLAAELHGRLIYALSIIVMPFLAIPLAIGSPRSNRYVGLVFGLVGMLAYQKTIEFGQKVAAVSQLPAGPFLWGSFAIFFGLSAYLFMRTEQAAGQTPFQEFEVAIRRRLRRLKNVYSPEQS